MTELPPTNKFELKFSRLAPAVIKRLKELKRQGWLNRGVNNPESVYEHTVALRNLVISEMQFLTEFSPQEKEEILDMLEIHDWPESDINVGDQVILKNTLDRDALKKKKAQMELEALIRICEPLGREGKRILELWNKFENGENALSSFARQVDKYQAIEKAFEYERAGQTVSTHEFIDGTEDIIVHPVLLKRLRVIKDKLAGMKNS